MNGKFIFIPNDDNQNYPFCILNYLLKGLDAAIRMSPLSSKTCRNWKKFNTYKSIR